MRKLSDTEQKLLNELIFMRGISFPSAIRICDELSNEEKLAMREEIARCVKDYNHPYI